MKSPLITMTAVTGKPTKVQISNYMKGMKINGIEQIMLYPRSGCELDYLSEEWFEAIGNFIEAARQLNMNIWLYDEFNWPSGDAGGRVTEFEEFRLKAISIKGTEQGRISYHSTHNSSLFGEKFFPNLLSDKAVDYFIECTHEKYYEKFSEYFGTVIKGFYTDEPSIGYCCTETSIPYYDEIEADYKKYCGHDFMEDLHYSDPDFCKNAFAVISEKFRHCYVTKIRTWCEDHHILMTGHFMADDTPFDATRHSGNFLENLSAFSLPGIDEIYTPLNRETFTRGSLLSLLGGSEYAGKKNGAMAELFALGPCDMSYTTKRCMIFLTACFKVSHYFLAVSHLDMRGNMKITDFFSNFMTDQPDFEGTVLLSEDAKIAAQYARKDFTPDVCIRYPTSLCAAHITDRLDMKPFQMLVNQLSLHHLQWKYVTESEECGNIPVIEFNEKMEYFLNGTAAAGAEELCSMLRPQITVTDSCGNPSPGFFVRKYNDDSFIAINLYGEPGTYFINGRKISFDRQTVFISTLPTPDVTDSKKEKITPSLQVGYCNDNMIRAMYVNTQTLSEICTDTTRSVCFAVRKGVDAYLSDLKIEHAFEVNKLSAGLQNLYDVSEPVQIKEGKHLLKSGNDYKYLPSVFIIGNFSVQTKSDNICGLILNDRKRSYICGEYFSDFGQIEFTTEITVPKGAKVLEIKGTNLYTCVYADHTLMGKRIYSPYIFDIPESLHGKNVTLKIVQYSSIAPVFGDVNYFEEKSETTQWAKTPAPTGIEFGFHEINWIY